MNKNALIDLAYSSVTAGLVLGAIGALGWELKQPWLFPSLGPTVFLQAAQPNEPSSRVWNTIAGHAIGIAAGFLCLALAAGAAHDPSALKAGPTLARTLATALAVALSIGGGKAFSAEHPPAAATTMLITLGAFAPAWGTVGVLCAGVVLCSALGETARYLHPSRKRAP